jgi:hypothetical protein
MNRIIAKVIMALLVVAAIALIGCSNCGNGVNSSACEEAAPAPK